jgi:hypothetical protein
MLQVVNVEVSESVAIACPKAGFKPKIVVDSCLKCAYFDGVGLMNSDLSRPWHERYAIRCKHVIERRTQPVTFEVNRGAFNKMIKDEVVHERRTNIKEV